MYLVTAIALGLAASSSSVAAAQLTGAQSPIQTQAAQPETTLSEANPASDPGQTRSKIKTQCSLIYQSTLEIVRSDRDLLSRFNLLEKGVVELLDRYNPGSSRALLETYAERANETLLEMIDVAQTSSSHPSFATERVEHFFRVLDTPKTHKLKERLLTIIDQEIDSISFRDLLSHDLMELIRGLDLPTLRSPLYAQRVADHLTKGKLPRPSGAVYPATSAYSYSSPFSPLSPQFKLIGQLVETLEKTVPSSNDLENALGQIGNPNDKQLIENEDRLNRYIKAVNILRARGYLFDGFVALISEAVNAFLALPGEPSFIPNLPTQEIVPLMRALGLGELAAQLEPRINKKPDLPSYDDSFAPKDISQMNKDERSYTEALGQFTDALRQGVLGNDTKPAIDLKTLIQLADQLPNEQEKRPFQFSYGRVQARHDVAVEASRRAQAATLLPKSENLWQEANEGFLAAIDYRFGEHHTAIIEINEFIEKTIKMELETLDRPGYDKGEIALIRLHLSDFSAKLARFLGKVLLVQVQYGSPEDLPGGVKAKPIAASIWNMNAGSTMRALRILDQVASPKFPEITPVIIEQLKTAIERTPTEPRDDIDLSDVDDRYIDAIEFIAKSELDKKSADPKKTETDRFFDALNEMVAAPEFLKKRYETAVCRVMYAPAAAVGAGPTEPPAPKAPKKPRKNQVPVKTGTGTDKMK